MDAETAYQKYFLGKKDNFIFQMENNLIDEEGALSVGFHAGYHARDAEVEGLKVGIQELRSGVTRIARRYSWLDGDLEDALLEQFEKCGALLKGGG